MLFGSLDDQVTSVSRVFKSPGSTTYSYYCYTKKGDVIVVTCTFSRRADGNIKLFDFSVSYVEKADRRAYFLKPGRFILYEWPGSSESDSQQPTTNN